MTARGDPHRDADHVEAEDVRIVGDRQVLAVVGEVDHRLQVEVLLGVVEDLREDVVGVEDAVGIRGFRRHRRTALFALEFVEALWVAVVVVDVAAHDVQDDEVVLVGVDLHQVWQQGLIVLVGEVVGVVGPFRVVGRLGDERDGAVVLAVASLIAEPVGVVARLLGDVEDGGGVEELLVVVLALLRQARCRTGTVCDQEE